LKPDAFSSKKAAGVAEIVLELLAARFGALSPAVATRTPNNP
jgi:hypothetical protein